MPQNERDFQVPRPDHGWYTVYMSDDVVLGPFRDTELLKVTKGLTSLDQVPDPPVSEVMDPAQVAKLLLSKPELRSLMTPYEDTLVEEYLNRTESHDLRTLNGLLAELGSELRARRVASRPKVVQSRTRRRVARVPPWAVARSEQPPIVDSGRPVSYWWTTNQNGR